ncbi:hypothetical protein [Alloprevotella sp. OH1205_COT-284]|uniref:hypothetical protein n=1 Tax=Alloprevotella sp. OH1205_COT-284 TaxID=2491043 RepID=UPI0013156135|nr:hypothetical protein [Alloprevotella sp. OH1205_COT-284]
MLRQRITTEETGVSQISDKIGNKRVAQSWFSTSWAISRRVLADRHALVFEKH